MPTLTPTVANFSITSNSWTTAYNQGGFYYYTTNITSLAAVVESKTFNFSTIPTGSFIYYAILGATTTLNARQVYTNDLSVNGGSYSGWDSTSSSPYSEDVTSAVQTLVTAGTKDLVVNFRFKGWSGDPPTSAGTFNNRMDYTGVKIFINYDPPYATKVWSNNQWVSGTPYVWNGSTWAPGVAYVWNGSAWVPGLM